MCVCNPVLLHSYPQKRKRHSAHMYLALNMSQTLWRSYSKSGEDENNHGIKFSSIFKNGHNNFCHTLSLLSQLESERASLGARTLSYFAAAQSSPSTTQNRTVIRDLKLFFCFLIKRNAPTHCFHPQPWARPVNTGHNSRSMANPSGHPCLP